MLAARLVSAAKDFCQKSFSAQQKYSSNIFVPPPWHEKGAQEHCAP